MIEFLKIRDVKDPKRNFGDAGIDIFMPEYTEQFINDLKEFNLELIYTKDKGIFIRAHEDIAIPVGIKSKFDSNLSLVACNKSGICRKTKLITGAKVIDSTYQGEWIVHLINTGNTNVWLPFGTKIVQFVPFYIYDKKFNVYDNMTEDQFYIEKTSRGAGSFGSTGLI